MSKSIFRVNWNDDMVGERPFGVFTSEQDARAFVKQFEPDPSPLLQAEISNRSKDYRRDPLQAFEIHEEKIEEIPAIMGDRPKWFLVKAEASLNDEAFTLVELCCPAGVEYFNHNDQDECGEYRRAEIFARTMEEAIARFEREFGVPFFFEEANP